MSKRCCAKLCFNSQITNKKVAYFGFPKHREFAHKWAIAAGREDLLSKSLTSLIKYFLCSEHFTNDCFVDGSHNTVLKKTIRPVTVPVPTLFKSNFDQYVPKQPISIEEHKKNQDKWKRNPACNSISKSFNEFQTVYSLNNNINKNLNMDIVYSYRAKNGNLLEIDNDDVSEELYFDKNETHYDGMSEYYLESDLSEKTDLNKQNIDDHHIIYYTSNEMSSKIEDEDQQKKQYLNADDKENDIETCRLCTNSNNDIMISIFGQDTNVNQMIAKLMPGQILKNDGLPQQICIMCYDKLKHCHGVLNAFLIAQVKLKKL